MSKVCYELVLVMWVFLIWFPLVVECSRKDEVCIEGIDSCKDASKDYTVPYCVSSDVDYACACNFSSLANTLSSHLNKKDFNTSQMLYQYCSALLWDQKDWRIYFSKSNMNWDSDWEQTFDSHQSLFVHLLCSSTVNKKWPYNFSEVMKWDVIKLLKLQQRSDWKDKCSLKDSPTLDDCDMSIYATEIFSAIMSDIFKIKYAQVLHIDSVKRFEKDKKKRVFEFLSWYFKIADEKKLKKFPDTVDVVDSNQQYYKSVLKKLRLLDNSKLADIAEESKCPVDWDMIWVDFVACALHGSQWKWNTLDPAFPTLFYNEILSYRIFVSYYSNRIQWKVDNTGITDEEKQEIWQPKEEALKFYSDLQIKAAKQTLRNFEEFNMTYPLHIWFLLYQEKLREFRNEYLPYVVKQFYSLSEKLQNVQLPN